MRYKDESGNWKSKNTGLRHDNPADRVNAKRRANTLSLKEKTERPSKISDWSFIPSWIDARWGNKKRTPKLYFKHYLNWMKYFRENKILGPSYLRREHVLNYVGWRKVSRNTAISEIQFLAMVMDEAINRGHAHRNVARRLGLRLESRKEKVPWTDEQIKVVGDYLEKHDPYGWLRVTFLLGLYQACRLRQCAVPIVGIDLESRVIHYPENLMKGGRPHSQPLDWRLVPLLKSIMRSRIESGIQTLCEIPDLASLEWRTFLNSFGFKNISHHCLRVTWITNAAKKGIPEALAMRFVNHANTEVHRIYQRFTTHDLAQMLDRLHDKDS